MSRPITTTLIAALALGVVAVAAEPASAMPVAGPLSFATPASAHVEQVRFHHHGFHHGFGYHRGFRFHRRFGYHRGFGYRRGLPGHPVRRILRAL